jgi:hypothetical protein
MSEMSEHRVPMLGASWRRSEDPTHSRDPRIRAVVGALAALPSPEPRAEFRAELRAQLVAIAPRVIGESAQTADVTAHLVDVARTHTARPATARPRHTDSVLARIRSISLGRPLAIAASVITVFALLLGGAVWMSKKALPGDTLYGLKRASENAELAFAGSNTEKARDYLRFAKTRVEEAAGLLSRATATAAGTGPQAGGVDSRTASLITSTLSSADTDVKSASSLLTKQAVKTESAGPLNLLTSWAPGQLARLHDLAAAMPDSALRSRTVSSANVVDTAVNRAKSLAPKVQSGCLDSAPTDDFGPLPVSACPSPSVTTPTHTTPSKQATSTRGASHGTTKGTNGTGSTAAPGAGTSTATAPAPKSSSTPLLNLSSLPLPTSTPTLPLTVSSCSAGLTLGPIVVGIGSCPSSPSP